MVARTSAGDMERGDETGEGGSFSSCDLLTRFVGGRGVSEGGEGFEMDR